jgi:FtsP/CotA-like multicopper oxidase with cupredoxin domain
MDGVIGITQKAIPAGEDFTYKFEISKTQSGTFWSVFVFNSPMASLTSCRYHSHSELQRADGLYGGLVIHKRFEKGLSEFEKYEYEDEKLLLIGDWYHRSAMDVQASYLTSRSSGHEVRQFQACLPHNTDHL